jgi:truncated hemoglobin YjbI
MYGDATPEEVKLLQEYVAVIKAKDIADRPEVDCITLYECNAASDQDIELLNSYFYEIIEAEKDLTEDHRRCLAELVQRREQFYNIHQGDMFNEVEGLRNDMMREKLENQPTNGKEFLLINLILSSATDKSTAETELLPVNVR